MDNYISLDDLKLDNLEFKDAEDKNIAIDQVPKNDIAIIGVSCKFAEANNLNEYWDLLAKGKECIRNIPFNRKQDSDRYFDGSGINNKSEEIKYTRIGYLDEIDKFDCDFFGIIPNEARLMNPRQRLFLETAWSAIEDSGYGANKLQGTKTGIYVGLSDDGFNEYLEMIKEGLPSLMGLSTSGNIRSILASRLAYILDFKGPAIVIDTACSSSLVALHLACQSIKNDQCETALVGGVNIKILPKIDDENLVNIGNASSDYKIKTFDNEADGTNSGEGVAAILIKSLSNAIIDNDHIYAVIKGSAINNDGVSVGITAPNVEAQENVILDAWKDAHIDPKTITHIEAHGTGTKLGDPIEVNAIKNAFSRFTNKKQFCSISSVKTNIGHLDSLAGLSGLIKMVMAMKNRKIPPSLNFISPNKNIDFIDSPVYVNDKIIKWEPEGEFLRCGISSFGLSGTNCHVILEEPPKVEQDRIEVFKQHIFTLSAKTKEALCNLINAYIEFLEKEDVVLVDVCYTVNTGRGQNNYRIALVVENKRELINSLNKLMEGKLKNDTSKGIYYGEIKKNSQVRDLGEEVKNIIAGIREKPLNIEKSSLHILSSQYCRGIDIDFEDIYMGFGCKKVSLPTYQFDKKRLWIELDLKKKKLENVFFEEYKHPLMGFIALDSPNIKIYVSYLNVKEYWVLNEHMVNGSYAVPGTAYIEMAREIGKAHYGSSCNIVLKNVMFYNLLIVEEDVREVQAIVNIKDNNLELKVISKAKNGEWIRHSEALIYKDENQEDAKLYDIKKLVKKCNTAYIVERNDVSSNTEYILDGINKCDFETFNIVEEDTRSRGKLVQVGKRWHSISKLFTSNEGALCELEIPNIYENDLKDFYLHPAMMDCAVNSGNLLLDGLYLPYYYKEFRIFGPTPKKFYSYILKKGNTNNETGKFDILLLNEQGKAFGKITNYIVKKVHDFDLVGRSSSDINMYHSLGWVIENDYKVDKLDKLENDCILIFKDKRGISDQIIKKLLSNGKEVIEVELGEKYSKVNEFKFEIEGTEDDYEKLFNDLEQSPIRQVIHMMTVDNENINDVAKLKTSMKKGVYSLFYLTKAITKSIKRNIQLLLIADYAQGIDGKEITIKPHNASFFGIGKVIGEEYSKISVRCIDIDSSIEIDDLMKEIIYKSREGVVGYRNGSRYIQQLKKVDLQKLKDEKVNIRKNGVYIITGGMGGIGIEIAKYISSREQVNLIIIGRSEFSNRYQENEKNIYKIRIINEIKESGSSFNYYKADVASIEKLKQVIYDVKHKFGHIDGIVHSAGVAGDGFIFSKSNTKFSSVIRPKIQGTWLLDYLTDNEKLDFFIMFSSITSLNGGIGQSDYTAANAYMDSYVDFRRRRKPEQKTLTINWTAWNEVGMLANYLDQYGNDKNNLGKDNNEKGFKSIDKEEAIICFDNVLNKDIYKVIIGEIDYKVFGLYKDKLKFMLSKEILKLINIEASGEYYDDELNSEVKERKDEITLYDYDTLEKMVLKCWTKVLGLEQISVNDKFYEIGGDSILATYLVKELQKDFPSLLDISDIFSYPSISEISNYIYKTLKGDKCDGENENIDNILNKLVFGEINADEANKLI
ncbi:type I polyketide synthase [Clostridium akagii]|uniref:type I polyketide synthase n=1 Tax=Clostridium akagii TaxID=91623 RepID=UPI00047B2025|nr:type I polyketide synthase [Clostridium akagii]